MIITNYLVCLKKIHKTFVYLIRLNKKKKRIQFKQIKQKVFK